jgi:4a-hydroxytetrahydrobiopterin dehydratase
VGASVGSVRSVTVWIRLRQFHDSAAVGDWRVLAPSVAAHFRTGSFAVGVELVDAIGALGDLGSAAPEVDLRRTGVTVRLVGDIEHGLREEYVELAQRISAAAADVGVAADPGAVREVQISIDALDIGAVRAFWQAVLGYREVGEEDLVDPLAGRRCGSSNWTRRARSATGCTWTSSSHPTGPRTGWRPRSPPADV